MQNFNYLIALFISILLFTFISSCKEGEQPAYFYSDIHVSQTNNTVVYKDLHNLSLTVAHKEIDIDESGFSPKLISKLVLKSNTKSPWPKAWVAFNINIYLKDSLLSNISRAEVMNEHHFNVSIKQDLPKFGINPSDVHLDIIPVGWSPIYPLKVADDKSLDSVGQNPE